MKRTAARLAGFSLGYFLVVLIERAVARLDAQIDDATRAPVIPLRAAPPGVGRPACNCTVCRPGERTA